MVTVGKYEEMKRSWSLSDGLILVVCGTDRTKTDTHGCGQEAFLYPFYLY
jgi:hypothetical protein